ncbi:hypothetical protein OOK58_58960 [Streptomyces sp. NBC_01728]|uniref:hypothetical protein n=1 Tax=unclassified Streptomyces TaxID=2593676 RepID=UPI00224EFE6E|nr:MULTISPECIES: hypothetical protein [unclassified Streptomyces]MCX4462390.1 hypothetical protein [Streptomyces sp. NBC_01719]MCX4500820.1 hypothetical protein [Streptomyces sp. NBC_01728]
MPTTSTNTQNHPLAPRPKRASGFLVVLVILWIIKPEFVEACSMWIGIVGTVVSFPVSGKDTTLVLRSKDAEKVTTGGTKLIRRLQESAMSFITRTAWWSSVPVLRQRVV